MERSLHNACKAALLAENRLCDIIVPRWAETYRCSEEDVREAWERAQTELSTQPVNTYGEPAE